MDKEAIKEKLQPIFNRTFKSDIEVTDSLTANDVDNWDSLTHMILISEVEKDFGITFKLKELNKMKNVGNMADIILSKL
ncbi:MAG TPA: acyl carrier protein [Flavobacterium sp.]|jgi:acyl carrier protein